MCWTRCCEKKRRGWENNYGQKCPHRPVEVGAHYYASPNTLWGKIVVETTDSAVAVVDVRADIACRLLEARRTLLSTLANIPGGYELVLSYEREVAEVLRHSPDADQRFESLMY